MEEWEVVIFVFQNESYRFNRKCGAVLVGNVGSSRPWAVFRDGTGRDADITGKNFKYAVNSCWSPFYS